MRLFNILLILLFNSTSTLSLYFDIKQKISYNSKNINIIDKFPFLIGRWLLRSTNDIYLKNSCSSINDELSKDIIFLTKSLGFTSIYTKIDKNKNYYKIHISGTFELFKELSLYLKYFKINLTIKYINHSLISFNIIKKGIDKYYGFETDNNKRFLLDSFIVTHNSSLMKAVGLNIIMAQCGLYVPAANFEYNIFT